MKIGIFGGAFCPPHKGHEKALLAFLRETGVDLCYVVPTGTPPHKKSETEVSPLHRLEMSRLAFLPLSEKVRILDTELLEDRVSYTYLTLDHVLSLHPESEIFLFAGSDQVLLFEKWMKAEYILSKLTLCTMARNEEGALLEEKMAWLEKEFGARLLLLKEKAYIISSSRIRGELEETGFSHSLSPAVGDYITRNGLFSSRRGKRKELLDRLEKSLSPARLSHTLAVERETGRLSQLFFHKDRKELCLAALCHDMTKEWTVEEQIRFLKERGALKPEDVESPAVLHGFSAALLAEEEGLLSPEGVFAVRFHTTGRENMSLGEKILYLADFIEETRPHEVCRRARCDFYGMLPEKSGEREAYLDATLLKVMRSTAEHLKEKNRPIHPLTLQGLADLERKESL